MQLAAMKNYKVISLLQTLNESEFRRLEAFVASDYFNRDEDLRRLLACLRVRYPAFSPADLDKNRLFQQLYPGQRYSDKQLRYLLSGLNKLAEHFLAIQKIEKSPYQCQLALLEELSQRGLEKSYRHADKALALQERTGDSGDYFFAQFRWAVVKGQHFDRQRLRRFDENIQHAAAQLDRYYFLHRLRIVCAMLDRQAILQARYQPNLPTGWIRRLEEQHFFQEAVIRLYFTIYQALSDENEETHFEQLKQGVADASGQIPVQDLRDIYLFAINYCARKIRQGKDRYAEEALHLYRAGITGHILIENGELSPWAFANVVKLSLRMRQYHFIEGFIEKYAPFLPPAFRENALHYNLAELYYYTGHFEKAQEQLHRVAFSDLNYYLGARVLLAKIYYETGAEEPLLALLASFTIFLKRNRELSNDLKHTYLNFCQLLFQIVRRRPARLADIARRIQGTELLTDRAWLEETCRAAMKDAERL